MMSIETVTIVRKHRLPRRNIALKTYNDFQPKNLPVIACNRKKESVSRSKSFPFEKGIKEIDVTTPVIAKAPNSAEVMAREPSPLKGLLTQHPSDTLWIFLH